MHSAEGSAEDESVQSHLAALLGMFVNFKGPPVSGHKAAIVSDVCVCAESHRLATSPHASEGDTAQVMPTMNNPIIRG